MTTGDVIYSLRFSLIKILPEPGFDLGSTAGESCVLTARLHMSFHSQMMILQEKHIPSNMSKPQNSMPWINGDLKKKIRRNNRLFKSRKKSQKHRSNFLKNRRNLQKQMRQARWDHINGIITQEGDKARKGLWRYLKQIKKDNTGITVLKKDGRSATSP